MKSQVRPCVVWGARGQGKVVFDIVRLENGHIDHFFDNDSDTPSPVSSVPISHGFEGLNKFVDSLAMRGLEPGMFDFVCAIGGGRGEDRIQIGQHLLNLGFAPRNVVHPSAVISPLASLGISPQILAGAIVGPYATLGDFVIINSGANVDHECSLGDGCHLAPLATLAGEVQLGRNVFVGANATILPRLQIGDGAIIGAGAVVTKDVPSGAVMVGNPARATPKS
jgi:sugar O-acyltransferase (sialic acid O-acetyltransferase NeuD family)